MSRLQLKTEIARIRNQKLKGENTRFVISDVLDKINDEKFGSEDTYTRTQINDLIAGVINGDYVPMNGTTNINPFRGTLYGKSSTTSNFFSIGGSLPELRLYSKTQSGNNQESNVTINNDSATLGYTSFVGTSQQIIARTQAKIDRNGLEITGADDTFQGQLTVSKFDKSGMTLRVYDTNIMNTRNLFFDRSGLRGDVYIAPLLNHEYVQKKYVDDAVAGIVVPTNFIPLAGATNITGALTATGYFTPTSANQFVQKKYVDDSISAIPQPTNFIPLAGSSSITGALIATAYYTPNNDNQFVQKKYVDDAVAGNTPVGFIPLAGATNITGGLSATGYFAPINNFSFVQKQYVDGALSAYIPMAGTTNISGKISAIAYYLPTGANDFVQKKYVDDSISAIPQPTNFIPLAGSSSITGALTATGYFAPSSANQFVQKQYVDELFATLPSPNDYVLLTGTSVANPITGTIHIIKDVQNRVVLGNSDISGNYSLSALTKFNTQTTEFRIEDGLMFKHSNTNATGDIDFTIDRGAGLYFLDNDEPNNYYSIINSSLDIGTKIKSKSFRGESSLSVYNNEVTISANNSGGQAIILRLTNENFFADDEIAEGNMGNETFTQKGYVDRVRSVNIAPVNTNAIFDDGNSQLPMKRVLIILDFVQSAGTTQNFDLTPYGIRNIFDVRGFSFYDNGTKQLPLNSGHQRGILTEFTYTNPNNGVESVTLSTMDDAFTAKVSLILEYS